MQRHINIKHKHIIVGVAAFLLPFIVSYMASAGFMSPGRTSAESKISASVTSGDYYINVSSLGEVHMDINATSSGTKSTANDTVTVSTNTPGYSIYLGTNSTNLNSNHMYLNGNSNSGYAVEPIAHSGTSTDNPTPLTANTWGYSLDGGDNYLAVPIKGNERKIFEITGLTAGENTINNHTVTYGAKADLGLPAGYYSSTITYSALASASSISNLASIYPNEVQRNTDGTFVLTITTPMMTNMDMGDWEVTIGNANCANVSVISGPTAKLICDAPKNLAAGIYTVTAKSLNYGNTYVAKDALTYQANSSLPLNIFNISNMQDMTPDICAATTKPNANATEVDTDGSHSDDDNYIPQTILKDTRDGKRYVVRKLVDDRCWMVQI